MEDDASIRAQGIMLTVLDSLLVSKGLLKVGELEGHLKLMAAITDETDGEAAQVLAAWVGYLHATRASLARN